MIVIPAHAGNPLLISDKSEVEKDGRVMPGHDGP
jgi:hypothetical protein